MTKHHPKNKSHLSKRPKHPQDRHILKDTQAVPKIYKTVIQIRKTASETSPTNSIMAHHPHGHCF
jgi:hypothetical protein